MKSTNGTPPVIDPPPPYASDDFTAWARIVPGEVNGYWIATGHGQTTVSTQYMPTVESATRYADASIKWLNGKLGDRKKAYQMIPPRYR